MYHPTSYSSVHLNQKKIKVFLLSPTLGLVNRGYEAFAQDCFRVLYQDPSLELILFKGGGVSSEQTYRLWTFHRNNQFALQLNYFLKAISQWSQKGNRLFAQEGYFLEQLSFFLSLIPHIYHHQPDIIYFADDILGDMLWFWKQLTYQQYRLLFRNGAPLHPPFPHWDFVQHMCPFYLDEALQKGEPATKHNMIPHGFDISPQLISLSSDEKRALRLQLNLPSDRPLLLSIGAIKKFHKRMDYVISEVSQLAEPRPYLLILGQPEKETPEIKQMGLQMLGSDHFQIRTVTQNEVTHYYKAADIFVLASLREGFGRVFVEAMSYGLPCLAHDYEVNRYLLGECGYLANFKLEGSLYQLLKKALIEKDNPTLKNHRHSYVVERFSWEKVRLAYIDMFHRCMECC
jgi:1,2-diacylglycerol 3-alpha-glucosyltransferase